MRSLIITLGLLGSLLPGFVSADGEKIYNDWCMICHAMTHNMPGTDRIREVYGDERADLKNSPFINASSLRILVREGRGMMPPFRRTEISRDELDELINYLVKENQG